MNAILVSQRVDEHPDRNEIRDALDHRLIDFCCSAGFLGFPVPNRILSHGEDQLRLFAKKVRPKGIILSGGNDIGVSQERDDTEEWLLNYAFSEGLPVLGICRGMQFIGKFYGVELKEVGGHVCVRHRILGDINKEVNSFHSMCIDRCPENFYVLARCEDGEIEAIRHRSYRIEAWMWHPERESVFDQDDIQRLRDLFN